MRTQNSVAWFVGVALLVRALEGAPPEPAAPRVAQLIAHRGSSADRPENTLAALRRAIEAGATAVEVDVRRTKDGQLVLLHDPSLDRTTSGRGPVRERTLDELRSLDAGAWFGTEKRFAGERLPTLADALREARDKIDVLLDLKEQGADFDAQVVAEVKQHGQPRRTIVGVRSIEQAKFFRRNLGDARQIGLIAEPDDLDGFVSVGVGMIRLWPKWLTAQPDLVERVRQSGAKLHLNATLGTPDEVLPLLPHRPDSLSSDDPAQLKKTLDAAPATAFAPLPSKSPPRIPILLDFDLGTDVDDAFALALVLASPELDLRGVTTVGGQAEDRAWMACRFLTQNGRRITPVAAGLPAVKDFGVNWQIQYRRHPAVVWNRTLKPVKESAVELLHAKLKESPGELTIVAIGPLTNVGKLLETHPDCRPWIKRIVCMSGSVRIGYDGKPRPDPEWNVICDIPAARRVLASGVPLTIVPLDACGTVRLERAERERLFAAHTPLTFQVQSLYELWEQETPILFDPVAIAASFTDDLSRFEDLGLEIDDRGLMKIVDGGPRVRVATATDPARFVRWYVDRLVAVGKPRLPQPPTNRSSLVDRGRFPSRVHVAEDYDTDIEKRWWMSGKAEKQDLPPLDAGSPPVPGRRANRAVLTQDFDDLQGDTRSMYRAVVFNPVLGPPMGPNTRLAFRYKLTGTDALRVQLYSLSNGYHRYLSVTGLPQGTWQSASVDMTQMRRPDGTGGPLAADERIDDIQFYIDPRAELLIDDVVLYDAAGEDERRPFPSRILFTGWFDTGRLGQEWPGDFEIVPHAAPLKWKFARSVPQPETKQPWLRVSLRGPRRVDARTELTFRYKLTGGKTLRAELAHAASKAVWPRAVPSPKTGEWTTATLVFDAAAGTSPRANDLVDEVRFVADAGEVAIDDLLLYTPGQE